MAQQSIELRLIKTLKMHLSDTGLTCALLGINSKNLWQDKTLKFYHFRNKDKVEVDIIIEQGQQLVGIEIKASATVTPADFKGLNKLKEACGPHFASGVVFYDGENVLSFGEKLFAVPISLLTPVSN